jgi:hypothetical protein
MDISSFLLGEITSRISKFFFFLYYIYKWQSIYELGLIYFMSYFHLLCIIFIHCINFLNWLLNFYIVITTIQCVIFLIFAYNMFEIMQDSHVERKCKKMNMYNKLFLVNLI